MCPAGRWVAFVGLFLFLVLCGRREVEQSAECIPLYAFYYGWYGTPEVSGKWYHWNADGHNPDKKDEKGLRDIAAVRHPYPDVYDSSDPSVIRRHIALARRAKIDGFIFSWWGKKRKFEDRVLKIFADIAKEQNFTFSIYFEGFVTGVTGNVSMEDVIEIFKEDLRYVSRYFEYENFLKIDRKPVVFVYGRAIFPGWWCLLGDKCPEGFPFSISWEVITKEFADVFFVGDDLSIFIDRWDYRQQVARMGFDGVHTYNPYGEAYFVMGKRELDEYLELFERYVEDARERGLWVALTVAPGYDDTALKRPFTWRMPRNNGETLRKLYRFAVMAKPDAILLTSFNEWHEGTEVEPSVELGDLYIKILAELRKNCKAGDGRKVVK